jgi:hypothetical protein
MCSVTILLPRCVAKFSFVFVLRTLVESRAMNKNHFSCLQILMSAKKGQNVSVQTATVTTHGVAMIAIAQVMTSFT